MQKIKFTVFADLHYKKGMYPVSTSDLEAIFDRAEAAGSELVLHLGDMCNDYLHSPEIIHAYLENKQGFEVYGIYGNHELESRGNVMEYVTPRLTNRADSVVWGSESGNIEDGKIAYYYFDKGDFRFIALDNNYSRSPVTNEFEHNGEASWGAPCENTLHNSLGERQLLWLRGVLYDAADKGKRCIILSHDTYCSEWEQTPDAAQVRELFKEANAKREGTVLLALNGHYHNNRRAVEDGVAYIDVNTVRNGYWQAERFYAYAEENEAEPRFTFEYTDYNENGDVVGRYRRGFSSLRMGDRSLFFEDALSANISVDIDGGIEVQGMSTKWAYGIAPEGLPLTPELLSISSWSNK